MCFCGETQGVYGQLSEYELKRLETIREPSLSVFHQLTWGGDAAYSDFSRDGRYSTAKLVILEWN